MKKTLFLMFILLLIPFVDAWDYKPHLIINESLPPNTSVYYKNLTLEWVNDSYYSSDNISLFLDLPNNEDCFFSFEWENITYPYKVLKGFFKSNFSTPEFFNITVQNNTFKYNLLNNTIITLPLNLTNQTKVNVTVKFKNLTYYYNVSIVDNQKPTILLINTPRNLIINQEDFITLLVKDDYFLKNISAESIISNKTNVKVYNKNGIVKVFVRTRVVNDVERILVKVTDSFNNTNNLTIDIPTIPKTNVFFEDVNIPLWKVGEEAHTLLYKGDTIKFNLTLTNIVFTPLNKTKNITKKYYSVWLENPVGKYSLLKNNTIELETSELKLGFVGLEKGNLTLDFEIVPEESVVSNDYFKIRINFGDFNIVENQSVSVGGRFVTCFLKKEERLEDSEWVCKSEFPITTNLDEQVMVLLKRDYNLLLDNFNYQIQQKNLLIKKYKLYFIFFMIISVILIIYLVLKKISLGFIKT